MLEWASMLGCQVGSVHFVYLGDKVGQSRKTVAAWDPLISRMSSKLAGWKCSQVNFAGRLTLTQNCLCSIPSYWFSINKIPKSVCVKLDMIRRKFLWGELNSRLEYNRKLHLMKWSNICSPKTKGGLGIRKVEINNQAFLAKMWWMITKDKGKKWVRFLLNKYGVELIYGNLSCKPQKLSMFMKDLWDLRSSSSLKNIICPENFKWKIGMASLSPFGRMFG